MPSRPSLLPGEGNSPDPLARQVRDSRPSGGRHPSRGVELDVSPDLPVVRGDRTRLLEVFQNLLTNAVRFLGDQPEPRIEVGRRLEGETTVCYVPTAYSRSMLRSPPSVPPGGVDQPGLAAGQAVGQIQSPGRKDLPGLRVQANPPEEVAFDELVREAMAQLAGQVAERGVEVEVAPDLPVIAGDRARLLEAVRHLLANAVQYLGDAPAPQIEVGCTEQGVGNGLLRPRQRRRHRSEVPRQGLRTLRAPRPGRIGRDGDRPGAGQAHRRGPRRADLGRVGGAGSGLDVLLYAARHQGDWRSMK